MTTSLELSEKESQIKIMTKYLPYGEHLVKIGPLDPEITK